MAGEMIPKAASLAKGADTAKGLSAAKDGAGTAKDAGAAAKSASGAGKGVEASAAGSSAAGGKGVGSLSPTSGSGAAEGAGVAAAGGGSGSSSGGGSGGGGNSTGTPPPGSDGPGEGGDKGDKGSSGSGGSGDSGGKGFGGMAPGGGSAGKNGKGGKDDASLMPSKGDHMKAGLAGVAAAPGAAAASQFLAIAAIMNWMKAMFMAAAALAANLGSMIVAAVVGVAKAAAGVAMGVGSAIAAATGGAVSAVVGAVSFGVSVVMVGAVAVTGVAQVSSNNAAETAQRDGNLNVCAPAMRSTINEINEGGEGGGDTSAETDANAEKVYSIFAGMGMSDENVAGILGNWDHESGVDPTGVETIFDEPYQVGPRKQAAWDAGWDISQVDPAYSAKYPAIDQMGIGLGQWTNGRNTLLMDYAKKVNRDWHELETQLGFMVSDDDPTRVAYIQQMISTPAGSPEAATHDFMSKWEGISDGSTGARVSAANSYFARMGQWEADEDLANSIIDQSGGSGGSADTGAVSAAYNSCLTETAGQRADNSTMAMAMTSYAYPTTAQGEGNDGTQLYQDLHDAIFPGDPWYMSCDRGVAVAVRWSGTDDNYPAGPVSAQLDYLASSDKWDEVTDWDGKPDNLQPGDVLLRYDGSVSHTVMYVGEEAVQQVHGDAADPGSNIASASLNTRSPGVGTWYTGSTGLETYKVYRNVKTETNSKYVDLMPDSGITGGDSPKGDGTYSSPVDGPITSGYGPRVHPVTGEVGKMHEGIDFGVPCGTPIKAAASGVITRETTSGGSGNRLDIDHGNGVSTGYFHQEQFKLHKGDSVRAGEVIGYVGTTGSSTGCHLHLAAMDSSGAYFDPMEIFSDLG